MDDEIHVGDGNREERVLFPKMRQLMTACPGRRDLPVCHYLVRKLETENLMAVPLKNGFHFIFFFKVNDLAVI